MGGACRDQFQFLIGSLKTKRIGNHRKEREGFQFLIGSLKTEGFGKDEGIY